MGKSIDAVYQLRVPTIQSSAVELGNSLNLRVIEIACKIDDAFNNTP